jgi:hypothetical protein
VGYNIKAHHSESVHSDEAQAFLPLKWQMACNITTATTTTTNTTTAIEFSLGVSSPYTSTDKRIRINIHKRNNKKHTVQTIQNTVNISTLITKTPTHTHTDTLQNK